MKRDFRLWEAEFKGGPIQWSTFFGCTGVILFVISFWAAVVWLIVG